MSGGRDAAQGSSCFVSERAVLRVWVFVLAGTSFMAFCLFLFVNSCVCVCMCKYAYPFIIYRCFCNDTCGVEAKILRRLCHRANMLQQHVADVSIQ